MSKKRTLLQFYKAEPKILVRRIINRQNRLSVTYCEEKLVFKKDINPFIITDGAFRSLYIVGILASKFISFIYLNSSTIAAKDDFRQTTLTELRKLPIPRAGESEQKEIDLLVAKVLELKSEKYEADTSDIEKQIDQLVYKLYDLTEEEIAIVENGMK